MSGLVGRRYCLSRSRIDEARWDGQQIASQVHATSRPSARHLDQHQRILIMCSFVRVRLIGGLLVATP